MPPLPAWYDGRAAVRRFFAERMFTNDWRLRPITANAQLGVACWTRAPGADAFTVSSLVVLTVRGDRLAALDGFLDPAMYAGFHLPAEVPEDFAADR